MASPRHGYITVSTRCHFYEVNTLKDPQWSRAATHFTALPRMLTGLIADFSLVPAVKEAHRRPTEIITIYHLLMRRRLSQRRP